MTSLGPTGIGDGVWRAHDERKLAKDQAGVEAVAEPCRERLKLADATLWCERPFNHEDIHEARIDVHSYLRWSYAGRRILPLDPEHEAREREESLRRQEEYRQGLLDSLTRKLFPDRDHRRSAP
ncbi:hypothetical protein OG216_09770 [Streptomycetaceae bacterium NBC_01309]